MDMPTATRARSVEGLDRASSSRGTTAGVVPSLGPGGSEAMMLREASRIRWAWARIASGCAPAAQPAT